MKSENIIWLAVGLLWTGLIVAFTIQAQRDSYATMLDLAAVEANASFNKDLAYRRWAARHGGVYVPVSEETQPSPYLADVRERDIVTPSGRTLTLVNPAYMTRQVHETAATQYGIKGHITSLDPFRPENKPDRWEAAALKSFAEGASSAQAVSEIDGKEYLRAMFPITTEKGCLNCHASQGYAVGDVRGGISVAVPLQPYLAIHNSTLTKRYANFLAIWLLGLTVLVVVRLRIGKEFLTVETDLSEARQLSAELAQQKAVWQKAQQIGAIGGWTIDILQNRIEWSDETYRIFGVPGKTGIVYRTFLENVHPDDRDLIDRAWQEALKGKAYDIEHRLLVDGKTRWVREKADVQFDDAGRPVSAIGFVQEITEQKKAENALLEMDRMKNEFISTAAHELRTPLTAMMGFTEFLLTPEQFGGFSAEQQQDFLKTVYDKGKALSRIIDDLLDISHIERGHSVTLDLRENDLREVLGKAVEFCRMHNPRRLFRLELPEEPGPALILIDRHRINQVLENLLGNAVKYSPEENEISITARSVPVGWEIRVTDRGIGMSPEQAARIFDRFYRADASDTAASGLGLGMSIAKQIIEAHGGSIEVASVAQQGTTITCTLPSVADATADCRPAQGTRQRPREDR